ncbi:MAG: heme lyase CcmF/NrfE family subunit [Candidatus Bipolaricaulia bacterium]
MPTLGYIVVFLSFISSVMAVVALVYGIRREDEQLIEVGRRSLHAVFFLTLIASVLLTVLFVTRDFRIQYVANYSSRDLSLSYTVAAFWAGQKGSLLFWELILSIYTVLILWRYRENYRYIPTVAAVLGGVHIFFTFILSFVSPPFELFDFVPADGAGLNPLLQNPGMIFHPTTQYLGYVGFSVPFAFAMAALIKRSADDEWLRKTRVWTIVSWLFLTMGIVLGGQWAYVELGWGGYWAWDPVENASLIPWATATAFLHSAMIQERKRMLKVWNVSLIALTFFFTIFGTFLTRSGILSSVHAFGEQSLGSYFLIFLALIAVVSIYLIVTRAHLLKGESSFEGLLAKESSFLINNILFLGLAFATFWGTVFPLISEAVTGNKVTVGPPFFNQVNAPLFLIVIILMGICPLIAWKRSSWSRLWRNLSIPGGVGVLSAVGFYLWLRNLGVAIGYGAFLLVAASILLDLVKETGIRRKYHGHEGFLRAAWKLVRIRSRKYGGYLVHAGIIIMAVGIVASSTFKTEQTITISPGETVAFSGHTIRYDGLEPERLPGKTVVSGKLTVSDGKRRHLELRPAKVFHNFTEEPHTEVSIVQVGFDDFYAILAGYEQGKYATFKFLYHPLINLIWLGFYVMLFGGVVSLWDTTRRLRRKLRKAVKR